MSSPPAAGLAPAGLDRLGWSLLLRQRLHGSRRALRRWRVRSRTSDQRPVRRSVAARAGLAAAVCGYVGYVGHLTIRHHHGFGTSGFDIGIFDQGLWLLSRFETPFVTVLGLHLFGDHTSFLLLALVPAYWLLPSPAVLLGAQALALGAGAIPTFLIARERLRSEAIALACALAYLAHPAVAWTNFENFHPDAFEVSLVLFAFYFVFTSRWGPFLASVGALLLVKEDVPLLTFALGLYVAARHHRRVGLATAAVSAAWFAAAVFAVLPAFNEVGTLDAWRVPTAQFGGFRGLLEALVTRPWDVAALALGGEQRWYVWQLLASFALLSLLAPGVLLVAAGPLASNVLSTFWYQYQIEYHYSTLIVPVLATSAVVGIARFRSLRTRGALAAAMLVAAVAGAYLWGPLGRDPVPVADPSSPSAHAARAALALIPPDAVVSAHYAFVPHLTHREQVYEYPNPWRAANWGDWSQEGRRLPFADDVDYLLLRTPVLEEPQHAALVSELERTGFARVFESEGVLLLSRAAAEQERG